MTNWKQNLAVAVTLILVSGYFLQQSLSYPEDSNTFPLRLSALLGLFSLCLAGQALWSARKEGSVTFVEWYHYRKVGMQVVLVAIFAYLAPLLGYFVAGFLLCFATACNGGYPSKRFALLYAVGVSLFVLVVFRFILAVPLPLGFFLE